MVLVRLPSDALLQHLLSYLGFFSLGHGVSLYGCSSKARDIVQETGIKITPMEKKCKKAKWLSEEALQIAVQRREGKEEKGKQRRKGKIYLFECRVPKNSKER